VWRRDLWVLPALIVAGAVALGVALVLLDPSVAALQELSPRLFTVSPDGARGVLTAIATAMLSVAGVVFSITIATLTLTSQQFTSRVLRTFVRDRGNQAALGVFLGVFAYCLVVLRSVRSPEEGEAYAPQLALLVAFALAMVGVAFLIYFISHIASTIQASAIVSRVTADTIAAIGEEDPGEDPPGVLLDIPEAGRHGVTFDEDGYVRGVAPASIARLADRRDWRVRLLVQTGVFVARGAPLASVVDGRGAPVELSAEDAATLRDGVWLAPSGDVEGDPGFGVRQLVDIALKALSPGVNDVTTALTCIDFLSAVLLAARPLRSQAVIRGRDGEARVLLPKDGFAELLNESMAQIRENGRMQVAVLLRQLQALERLAEAETDPVRLALLAGHAAAIEEAGARGLSSAAERRLVAAGAARLRERAGAGGAPRAA
jgi:uncharacterized membrane protein